MQRWRLVAWNRCCTTSSCAGFETSVVMKLGYHPLVQREVNEILRDYDRFSQVFAAFGGCILGGVNALG